MSERIHVECPKISTIFGHLSKLIPNGEKAMNLTVKIQNNKLFLVCKSSIWYKAFLCATTHPDTMLTIRYYDLATLFSGVEEFDLLIQQTYVELQTPTLNVVLQAAYDFEDLDFTVEAPEELFSVSTQDAYAQLRSFLATASYFGLMKKEYPYEIHNNIILLKTPSIWFQGRCGFNINASLTLSTLRTLIDLAPDSYYTLDKNLYITSANYIALLPIQQLVEEKTFVSLLEGMSEPTQFDTGNTNATLNSLSKLATAPIDVTIYNDGLQLYIHTAECQLRNKIGNCTKMIYTARVPTSILSLVFRMLGNNNIAQVLYKEGILCFRTNTTSMVLHAMR